MRTHKITKKENNQRKTLVRAVLQAEKNGYKDFLNWLPVRHMDNPEDFLERVLWVHRYQIIFSHAFAKAFWGEDIMLRSIPFWEDNLQEMVLEKDPIQYLQGFLRLDD